MKATMLFQNTAVHHHTQARGAGLRGGFLVDHVFLQPKPARTDSDGRHYQICVDCGTAYQYDWKKMRRTHRLVLPAAELREAHNDNHHSQK